MKTIVKLVVALLMVTGLIGCAATSAHEPAKVKCPACGYEIELPHGI